VSSVSNQDAARTLFGVAALLESQGANRYRVRAYRRAALSLMRLATPAEGLTDQDGQLNLPWLGPRLRRKLGELLTLGRMQFHVELIAELPPALRELLSVPGVGPKTAERLIRELDVRSVEQLARAAQQHRLRALRGIGELRERRLGEAAAATLLAPAA
jgi:DNA polymerase (family 10)